MSTPIQIAYGIITGTNQVLYTAFSGSLVTTSMLTSLDLSNIAPYDVSINIWWENSNNVVYLVNGMVVPAQGNASYRGLVTFQGSGEKLKASPSATGVHVLGTVMEQ